MPNIELIGFEDGAGVSGQVTDLIRKHVPDIEQDVVVTPAN